MDAAAYTENILNALDSYPNDFTSATLNQAILDSYYYRPAILLIKKGEWEITDEVDFSGKNLIVKMEPGAVFTQGSGYGHVTMPEDFILTNDTHFDSVPGFVTFPTGAEIRAEWWEGAFTDVALTAAVAAAEGNPLTIVAGAGSWSFSNSVNFTVAPIRLVAEAGAIFVISSPFENLYMPRDFEFAQGPHFDDIGSSIIFPQGAEISPAWWTDGFNDISLGKAISSTGSNSVSMRIPPGTWTLDGPVDFLNYRDIRLIVEEGAVFTDGDPSASLIMPRNYTLTNTRHFQWSNYFVTFPAGSELNPTWWLNSSVAAAFQGAIAAADGNRVTLRVPGGDWVVDDYVDFTGTDIQLVAEAGALFTTYHFGHLTLPRDIAFTDGKHFEPGTSLGFQADTALDARWWGVMGDGRRGEDGGISASSSTFNCTAGFFTAADVGRKLLVPGARKSNILRAKIAGYTNATTVTLNFPAHATRSSAAFTVDGAPYSGGNITASNSVFTGPSIFSLGSVGKALHIPGAGDDVAIALVSTIVSVTDSNTVVLADTADYSVSGVAFVCVADDTAALNALEGAVYSSRGGSITLPPGLYGYAGSWVIRAGLSAYGATLVSLEEYEYGNGNDALLYVSSQKNRTIAGLTVDCQWLRPGIWAYGADDLRIEDCVALNTISFGITVYAGERCQVLRCVSKFVRYPAYPRAGAADAFYTHSSKDIRFGDCYAYDFRRIGFVIEGDDGIPSERILVSHCRAEYAHGSEESNGQYNAGFWAEHANGATFTDCDAVNTSSGEDQNGGAGTGFVVGGSYTEACAFHFTRCRVYGNAAEPYDGYSGVSSKGFSFSGGAGGATGLASVFLSECQIDSIFQGVHVYRGIGAASIEKLTLTNCNSPYTNAAGIIVDGGEWLRALTIASVLEIDCSHGENSGTILFYGSGEGVSPDCVYTLRDCPDISHATSASYGAVGRAVISNCGISYGCSSRMGFSAPSLSFENCHFTARSGSNMSLAQFSNGTQPGLFRFSGCDFRAPGSEDWLWQAGGAYLSLAFSGCEMHNGTIQVVSAQTYRNSFVNCRWFGYPSYGAINTNYTSPANGILRVIDCTFERLATSSTIPPVKKLNYSPGVVYISGCLYDADDITDLDGVIATDNTQI